MHFIDLPHDYELEKKVLGIALLFPKKLDYILNTLFELDFYSDRNRNIFSSLRMMWTLKEPVDLVLACHFIQKRGNLNICGGITYLSSLLDGLPKSEIKNIEHYCRKIREMNLLREIMKSCYGVAFKGNQRASDPVEMLVELRKLIDNFFEFKKSNEKLSNEGQNESAEFVKAINS